MRPGYWDNWTPEMFAELDRKQAEWRKHNPCPDCGIKPAALPGSRHHPLCDQPRCECGVQRVSCACPRTWRERRAPGFQEHNAMRLAIIRSFPPGTDVHRRPCIDHAIPLSELESHNA